MKSELGSRSYLDPLLTNPDNDKRYLVTLLWMPSIAKIYEARLFNVGGTLSNLLNPDTKMHFDFGTKTVLVQNHNPITFMRSDGSPRDIDVITDCPDRQKYLLMKKLFREACDEARKRHVPFPDISIEPVMYPNWPAQQKWRQLVSSINEGIDKQPSLVFRNISVPVDPQTLTPWIYMFENEVNLIGLNPFAHFLRYFMRTPGPKQKDMEYVVTDEGSRLYSKLSLLQRFADNFLEAATCETNNGLNYQELFNSWIVFIEKLMVQDDFDTRSIRILTQSYWNTLGKTLSRRGNNSFITQFATKFTG